MSFEHSQRWFFRQADTPARLKRLLRSLTSGNSLQLLSQEAEATHWFTLRCPDEEAVYELLDAIGSDAASLLECAFDYGGDGYVSEGATVELNVYPDKDGSFEWILEVSHNISHESSLTLLVARALAERLGGKHYDDLSNEELLAGQTLWMAPPPIIKATRPN